MTASERGWSAWRGPSYLAFSALMGGCALGAHRGTPLYAERPLPPISEVATVQGDIAEIDGKSVAGMGRTFELIPGCHQIVTVDEWGESYGQGNVSARFPAITMNLELEAGLRYVIRFRGEHTASHGGSLRLEAYVEDVDHRRIGDLGVPGETQGRFSCAPELPSKSEWQEG